jgi:hypothetical protein
MLGRLGYDGAKTFGYASMGAWEILGGIALMLGLATYSIDWVLSLVGIHAGFNTTAGVLVYTVFGLVGLLVAGIVLLIVVTFWRWVAALAVLAVVCIVAKTGHPLVAGFIASVALWAFCYLQAMRRNRKLVATVGDTFIGYVDGPPERLRDAAKDAGLV